MVTYKWFKFALYIGMHYMLGWSSEKVCPIKYSEVTGPTNQDLVKIRVQ